MATGKMENSMEKGNFIIFQPSNGKKAFGMMVKESDGVTSQLRNNFYFYLEFNIKIKKLTFTINLTKLNTNLINKNKIFFI